MLAYLEYSSSLKCLVIAKISSMASIGTFSSIAREGCLENVNLVGEKFIELLDTPVFALCLSSFFSTQVHGC